MAETNGSGRMDRVEATLERLAAAQERDHDNILLLHSIAKMQQERTNIIEANVATMQAEEAVYRARQRAKEAAFAARDAALAAKDVILGERIDKLVSAIGDLISRIPPPQVNNG